LAGAPPQTPLLELTALPQIPSWIWERGRERRKGRGERGRGSAGKWKEEGEGRKCKGLREGRM